MTDPKYIISKNDTSNRMNLYRTFNDRTLSEEYNLNSPNTKSRIKSMCGTSPTSNFKDALPSSHISSMMGILQVNKQYKESNVYERGLMVHYGLVSHEFHNNNKGNNIKDAEK